VDALLIVDVQNDFCKDGPLECHKTDTLIPSLNNSIKCYEQNNLPIIFTQDWHPEDHISFKEWPKHCVAGTKGAELVPELYIPRFHLIARKGTEKDKEQYSIFKAPGFKDMLNNLGITHLTICGLATEYCIQNSARDAVGFEFRVTINKNLIRPVKSKSLEENYAIDFFKCRCLYFE